MAVHLKARSSRNVPTGVGSRGGIGHRWSDDPVAWAARARRWRANHADYRERDNARRCRTRRALALERDRREVDELVARLTPAGGHSTSRSSLRRAA